jgi:hypothetical protein
VKLASPQAAWLAWLDEGKTVPKGLAAFLRAAEVSALEDGRLAVRGLAEPAAERLSELPVMDAIREGLTPFLGRAVRVVIDSGPAGSATVTRVTEEEARSDTLKALYRQEPRLEQAVQELDLELME